MLLRNSLKQMKDSVRLIWFKCIHGHFTQCSSKKREYFCIKCNTFLNKREAVKYTDKQKGRWGKAAREAIHYKHVVLCPVTPSHYREYHKDRKKWVIIIVNVDIMNCYTGERYTVVLLKFHAKLKTAHVRGLSYDDELYMWSFRERALPDSYFHEWMS